MQQILLNIANKLLIQYCLENNVDCSGTYIKKDGRGYSYSLHADPHTRPDIDPRWTAVARITFHKSGNWTYGFA